MGRFSVEFVVGNYGDVLRAQDGLLEPDKIRRCKVTGVVDSGASRVVLPQALARQLGLRSTSKVKVRYADGRTATRPAVEGVYIEILGTAPSPPPLSRNDAPS